MAEYILRIDGVNIGNFVGDTNDLSTIRGGGLILLNSITNIEKHLNKSEPSINLERISVGASSGLFKFTSSEPNKIITEVKNFLQNNLYKHATFVVNFEESTNEFKEDKEMLIAKNRWSQMQSPSLSIPTHNQNTNIIPCSLSRVRPSVVEKYDHEGKKQWISSSVKARRKYGKEQKQIFYQEQTNLEIKNNFTNTFTELTSNPNKGNLNGKMAVIYLDGNKFGTMIRENCKDIDNSKDFDEYLKEFDKNLRGNQNSFLRKFIVEINEDPNWLYDKDKKNLCQFETLMWGGDEIMWVVPAWQGWFTLKFFYRESSKWKFMGKPMTHSAGIVFCGHKAPINRVKRLAEDLANSVKKHTETTLNCFAYEILESFDHIGRNMDKYRHERTPAKLKEVEGSKVLFLDGTNIDEVIEKFLLVKNYIPRRRLYRIADFLISGEPVKDEIEMLLNEVGDVLVADNKTLADILCELSPKLGSPECSNLNELIEKTTEKPMLWHHLNALWDYLI